MNTSKPNVLFWIVALVPGLIWNLYGVGLFIYDTFIATPESLAAVYNAEQIELINNVPIWSTILYGVATISGLLGSIFLLLKKKFATLLFGISLFSILATMLHGWFFMKSGAVMGTVMGYVIPIVVITVGFLLYFYSRRATSKGWLA